MVQVKGVLVVTLMAAVVVVMAAPSMIPKLVYAASHHGPEDDVIHTGSKTTQAELDAVLDPSHSVSQPATPPAPSLEELLHDLHIGLK